jgi:hypothetical protein
LNAICLAKVAEEVLPPEMHEKHVLVDKPLLAELAERVAAMGGVVRVTLALVRRKLAAVVQAAFVCKVLKYKRI